MHSCCAFFSGCLCSSNLGVWPVPHCDLLATPRGRFHRSLCCRKCVSCWGDAVVVSAGVVGKHCACAHLECWPHQVGVMIAVFMFVSETLGFGRAAVALKCPSQIVVLTHAPGRLWSANEVALVEWFEIQPGARCRRTRTCTVTLGDCMRAALGALPQRVSP